MNTAGSDLLRGILAARDTATSAIGAEWLIGFLLVALVFSMVLGHGSDDDEDD